MIIKASFPTIILPVMITGTVIYYFGLTLNSLLAILFLGELYTRIENFFIDCYINNYHETNYQVYPIKL